MIRVYAYVVADLLHIGQLKCLEQAKALGDYLIVGVITDEGVATYKRSPVIPLKERMYLVNGFDCVDEVIVQHELDPTDNLKQLGNIDILVHGDDWGEDFPGANYMRSIGKQAIRTKYYRWQSTTRIIRTILQRYRKYSPEI